MAASATGTGWLCYSNCSYSPVESFKAGLHGPLPGPLPAPKRPSARLVEPVDILPEWGMCSSVLFSKQVLNNFRRSFTFTPSSLVGLGSTE